MQAERKKERNPPSLSGKHQAAYTTKFAFFCSRALPTFIMSSTVTVHVTFTDGAAVILTSQARNKLSLVTEALRGGAFASCAPGKLLHELQL